ncbi:hypothetical protein [Yinghuangia sp. YIM S09857]|uniref:hypothetical protein n=1 Tax=Yinghuangia sp. YIM S09857 TaxID=3436929 RepID=UPI003F529452
MTSSSTRAGGLTVERVTTRSAFAEFCAVPLRLHPRDRYVPPIRRVLADLWRGRGPHSRYGPVEFHLVRDADGRAVGRTCLHANPKFDEKLGARHQLYGLTEFTEDPEVAATLVHLAEERARAAGREALFGPVALLPNQTGGVITSGFESRGFVDSAWNPAYYPSFYESLGFTRRFEAATWICEDLGRQGVDVDAVFRFDDARMRDESLVIRHGSRKHLAEQLPVLRTMLNASFAQLGYYTPIDADELRAQTDGLAYLLDESLLMWLERAGEPVAFVLVVPDISEFLAKIGGDLRLVNQVRLLATRRRYRREAVLIIKGTVPEAQGRGYLTLLARELYRNLRVGGYTALRSTWVEDDNAGSAAQYVRMGGRVLHGHTFYGREVRA